MLVGVDIDATIDAAPSVFLSLMQALRTAGHRVVVLTGCADPKVTPQDMQDKTAYLNSLGLGEAYDELVVFSDPTADKKAQWLREHKADLFIDDKKTNLKAAEGDVFCLRPWQSRTK